MISAVILMTGVVVVGVVILGTEFSSENFNYPTTTWCTCRNDVVKVYDGNSLRAPVMQMNGSTSTVLSRFNAVIIVYNKTASSSVGGSSSVSLHVNYTTFSKCVYVCVCACMRVCVCMHMCMSVCVCGGGVMHACMHACVHIHMCFMAYMVCLCVHACV